MGVLKNLQKLEKIEKEFESKKEKMLEKANPEERTEEEEKEIRKSYIWTTINLVLSIVVGVALYFLTYAIIDAGVIGSWSFVFTPILIGVLFTSVGKARIYAKNESDTTGTIFYANFVLIFSIIMVIGSFAVFFFNYMGVF